MLRCDGNIMIQGCDVGRFGSVNAKFDFRLDCGYIGARNS